MSKILSLEIETLPNQTTRITFLTLAFIILLFASFATDKFHYQPCSGITFLFMHLELHHVFPSFNALPSVYLYLPQWSFSSQLE